MTALYRGTVTHVRRRPVVNQFRYATSMWLVDLDDLPVLPLGLRWAARWRAEDHIGKRTESLRANAQQAFERLGADVRGCRLLLLANPRGLGHGFNPISIHWALDWVTGEVRAVLAEVHNTYGGRHAYLLDGEQRPDGTVTAEPAKQLYVSPFYGTDGRYSIRVSPPDERITVVVRYQPQEGPAFVATMTLEQAATFGVGTALRTAGAAWRTSALIRRQGIKLWARGVPIHDRELSDAQPAIALCESDKSRELEVVP